MAARHSSDEALIAQVGAPAEEQRTYVSWLGPGELVRSLVGG